MAVGTAPELTIAVNAPVAAVLTWLLIILLFIFTVVKAIALLIAVKAPVPAFVPEIILLPEILSMPVPNVIVVIPVNIEAAVPPAVHPVMMLSVMVTLLPAPLVIPVNEFINAALPVTRFVIIFPVIVIDSVAPELIAVMGAVAAVPVVILLIVSLEMVLEPAVMDMAVTAADPPVQLRNTLLLNVLFKLVLAFDQPVIAVAPITVTFEKLLLFWVMEDPFADMPLPVQNATVPPAPVFENPVTIELPLTVCTPVIPNPLVTVINVTPPVVLTLRLVKVLLLIFCDKVTAELVI